MKHFKFLALALLIIALGVNIFGAIRVNAQTVPGGVDEDTPIQPTFVIDLIFPTTEPLSGTIDIYIEVPNTADKVELDLENFEETTKLGDASGPDSSGTRWHFIWDTTLYENGEYRIVPRVRIGQDFFVGEPVLVAINNPTSLPPDEFIDELESTITQESLIILPPPIYIFLPGTETISGTISIYVEVAEAEKVHLFAYSIEFGERPLGEAVRPDTGGEWIYVWDTTEEGDGEYSVIARVEVGGEGFESDPVRVVIDNVAIVVQGTVSGVDQLAQELEETSQIIADIEEQSIFIEEEIIDGTTGIVSEFASEIEEAVPGGTYEETFVERIKVEEDKVIREIERIIEEESKNISSGSRDRDKESVLETKEKIVEEITESLGDLEVLAKEGFGVTFDKVEFQRLIEIKIDELEEAIERRDRIIKEDIGPAIFNDSDNDGVSDFYEINVYRTDPLSADTDSDGIVDSIEILTGSDPRDSDISVKIEYEDPKISGVVTPTVFELDSIEVIETQVRNGVQVATKIEIRGTALPNSFVTIYIFSIPIIVTVQADSNGRWVYELDKELDDGEHEIYTAIVDNSGKILAKSNAVPFVKTAAAIQFVPTGLGVSKGGEPRFLNTSFLIILAIILFAIFVITLILVGTFSKRDIELSGDQQKTDGDYNQ